MGLFDMLDSFKKKIKNLCCRMSRVEAIATQEGVVLPSMTKAERNLLVSPSIGLMIFQTDNTPGLRVYNGTNWMRFTETID